MENKKAAGKKEILVMKNISKTFGGTKVLDNVEFHAYAGEVHALMGANGAGKSTLMKILAGVYTPDEGAYISHDGREAKIMTRVADAQRDGVTMVFQELNILPQIGRAHV